MPRAINYLPRTRKRGRIGSRLLNALLVLQIAGVDCERCGPEQNDKAERDKR